MRLSSSKKPLQCWSEAAPQRDDAEANLGVADQPATQANSQVGLAIERRRRGAGVLSGAGETAIRLFCPIGQTGCWSTYLRSSPSAAGRLSFGIGGAVVALVADRAATCQRGGCQRIGPVPADIKGLVAGPIATATVRRRADLTAAPPSDLSRAFVPLLRPRYSPPPRRRRSRLPPPPCLVQDGELCG